MSLDPSTFVDTSAWSGELLNAQQNQARSPKRSTKPPTSKPGKHPPTPSPGEIESLEQMLEPDRTGLHAKGEGKPPWALIIVIMLLLAAGAAVAVVVMMQ